MGLRKISSIAIAIILVAALGGNFPVTRTDPPIYLHHILIPALSILFLFLVATYSTTEFDRPYAVRDVHGSTNSQDFEPSDGQKASRWKHVADESVTGFYIFKSSQLVWILLLGGYVYLQSMLLHGGDSPELNREFAKLIFLFFSFYSFAVILSFTRNNLDIISASFSLGVLVSVFIEADYRGLGMASLPSRVSADALGGYNAYGFVVGVGFVFLLYLLRRGRGPLVNIVLVLALGVLFFVELGTLSRGGFLTLSIGASVFLVFSDSGRGVRSIGQERRPRIGGRTVGIFFILLIPILLTAVFPEEVRRVLNLTFHDLESLLKRFSDLSGSRRTDIWRILIGELWHQGFWHMIVGNGLGSIEVQQITNFAGLPAVSAHSTYVEILYTLGFVGFGLLLAFLSNVFVRTVSLPRSNEKALLLALFIQVALSATYDSYYLSSQIGWIVGFILAVVYEGSRYLMYRHRHLGGTVRARSSA